MCNRHLLHEVYFFFLIFSACHASTISRLVTELEFARSLYNFRYLDWIGDNKGDEGRMAVTFSGEHLFKNK